MTEEDLSELEEAFLELFGDLYLKPLEEAKISPDRYPEIIHVLSHVRECLDEDAFKDWVDGYIDLETPYEDYLEEPKKEGTLLDLTKKLEKSRSHTLEAELEETELELENKEDKEDDD